MKNESHEFAPAGLGAQFLFPGVGTCQAYAEVSGASIELRRYAWAGRMHEGSFATSRRFVELTDIKARGGYKADEPEWRSLGLIRFYPGSRRFYSRWYDDEQTSLLCALDLERLAGLELNMEEARLAECGDVRNAHLHALLLRIREELLSPGFASTLVIEAACMGAAAELVQHFSQSPDRVRERGDKLSAAAIEQIGLSIRAGEIPGSLRALAEQEGVSARQYARLFHATAGETVGRFCARQLILRAKDLLSDRSLLTKEVAFRCGFANTASFARAFRRETGLSPKAYRQGLGQ